MNHMYAYSRDNRKIKFRMASAQHFINEAPDISPIVVFLNGGVTATVQRASGELEAIFFERGGC